MAFSRTLRWGFAFVLCLGAAFAAGPARGQDPAAARLDAINQAIEEANAAARRGAATVAAPPVMREDGRLEPGQPGYLGAAPPEYPAGSAGPARPKGPGGRSVSTGKGR